MTPELMLNLVIRPTLDWLDPKYNSRQAHIMLLAMALQESRLKHRRQIRGPARGFWQFEAGGGVAGVLRHSASRTDAVRACNALSVAPEVLDVYTAIEHNDQLACIFARLLLWTLPSALPTTAHEGWEQYLDAWRPGKPHQRTWANCWATAFAAVNKG